MTLQELEELRDGVINPVTAIIGLTEDEDVKNEAMKIVDYINNLKAKKEEK